LTEKVGDPTIFRYVFEKKHNLSRDKPDQCDWYVFSNFGKVI